MEEIDDKAEGYLQSVRSLSPEKRTGLLSVIKKLFGKSREFGDDKVQLAMQTYEMVGKMIFFDIFFQEYHHIKLSQSRSGLTFCWS